MADAEGLKHAPETVVEVVAQHDHSDDVEERNGPDLKAVNHIVIDVMDFERPAGMNGAKSEMEKVEDDESENDRAGPHHGARSVGGGDVLFFDVADRACFFLQEPQLERRPDVKKDGDEKADARGPEEAGMGFQSGGIVIELLGGDINLKVAEKVADDKAKQHDARDGHDGFLADGGLPETECAGSELDSSSAHKRK